MRVTAQMNRANSLYRLSGNNSKLSQLTERIMAEQQVLRLQDNSSAAVNGIKLLSIISRTEQYCANIKTGTGTLALADVELGYAKSILDEMKDLLTGSASDSSTTPEQRATMAIQVQEMLSTLMIYANAKDGERYIFGGTYSANEPFTTVGGYVSYNGNDESILLQTGQNATTAVNCTGSDAFGNMTTTVAGGNDLDPHVSLCTDVSTPLSALNGGAGVPKGKIVVYYSSYPNGLEIDLTNCDTLEDVKDTIERATLEASRELDPKNCEWLDNTNLDWRDLTDRYVKVTLNPDGTGISLQEFDLGEPLPAPTVAEARKGLDYSGDPGYTPGGGGAGIGAGTVHDKDDYVYGDGTKTYAALRVDNCAGNTVATELGIKGTAYAYDPLAADPALDGFIHGKDLNPVITASTLLADLAGYNDAVYTITNGDRATDVTISETTTDTQGVFWNWDLSNLSIGDNTGKNGELYARVTRRGPPDNDFHVELYAVPLDKAKSTDLVATGSCSTAGGTVQLKEANNSGLGGSVGIVLGAGVDEATVDLKVEMPVGFQASVHVPAFVEETDDYGVSVDTLNLLSGWHITGLDKPPAEGHDLNHPASTDREGNMTVRFAQVANADGTTSLALEIYRPAYDDQPEELIATGELNLGTVTLPLDTAVSGRIAIQGAPGFEGVSGSVYVELPAGEDPADLEMTLTATFATVGDLMRAVEEAGVHATAGITADGTGIEFRSQLTGAYLTVSEDADCYEQLGDTYQQLSGLDLNGLVHGVNADASGNVYTEVAYYPPDAGRTDGKASVLAADGTYTLIDAGYYVRLYSDPTALEADYADRDNASLVAEGYLAAGAWDTTDPANPFVPVAPATTVGLADNLVLEERNHSGLSGTVDLNYYGGRDQATLQPDGSYDYMPYDNADITVSPGGLRSLASVHTTIQEIDLSGFAPGTLSDYSGTAHGTIAYDAGAGTTTVCLYRDASHTRMLAKGELNAATGEVTLYETDKSGNYVLDASGNRIVTGSLVVAENTLPDGQTDKFTITMGGQSASGQAREDNLFATIHDVTQALHSNDVDALHDLIDTLKADIDRLLAARSDVGARGERLELLNDRYQDDILSYTAIITSTVGMDSDALAKAIIDFTAAENAYNASMQVAARYLNMSLLDYM